MDFPEASPASVQLYEEVASTLAPLGVKAAAMFGMPTLKVEGKAVAGLYGDAMNFKLSGPAHAEALALQGAHLFDPSGLGRPMKAWVVVPVAHAASWERLARLALAEMG